MEDKSFCCYELWEGHMLVYDKKFGYYFKSSRLTYEKDLQGKNLLSKINRRIICLLSYTIAYSLRVSVFIRRIACDKRSLYSESKVTSRTFLQQQLFAQAK